MDSVERKRDYYYNLRRKKRRLRNLVSSVEPVEPKPWENFLNPSVLLLMAIAMLMFFTLSNKFFVNQLKNIALNQYQLSLHGRINYCKERFNYESINSDLSKQVIGQDNALNEINQSFQQHKDITALALIGPQGVGKTLTLNIIQTNFQWHLNVQQYLWLSTDSEQSQLKNLLKLIENLSTCGQNGIFIDNIPLKSVNIIREFNEKLLQHCNKNNIRLIAIYVIQIDSDQQISSSVEINNVKSINFRQFDVDDLHNCFSIECDRLKVTNLTPDQINWLIKSIDVKRNGCKTVAAITSRYVTQEKIDM